MSAKFTPGPWVARPPRLGAAITVYAGDVPIATTASNTSERTMQMHRSGEVKANARLIAAAPDLYEALRSILGWRELRSGANEFPIERIEDIARAALAKAEAA